MGFTAAVLVIAVALMVLVERSTFPGPREIRGPLSASDQMLVQRSLGSDLPSSFAVERAFLRQGKDHTVYILATVTAADAERWQTRLVQEGFAPSDRPVVLQGLESPSWMNAEVAEVGAALAKSGSEIAFEAEGRDPIRIWITWGSARGGSSVIFRVFD